MKKFYLPGPEPERVIWINNFADKLPGYATLFNLTAVEIAEVEAARQMYAYIVQQSNARKTDMKNVNEFKAILSFAPIGTPIGPVPVPEILPAPAAVPSGVFTRIGLLVQGIKNKQAYTTDVGDDLRIIGEELSNDPALLQPILKIKLGTGGHPVITFKKNRTDWMNLYADRGDGQGFKFLTSVKKTKYTDMAALPGGATPPPVPPSPSGPSPSPNPTNGNAAVWTYKGVYVIDDVEVGQYSSAVSIPVGAGV